MVTLLFPCRQWDNTVSFIADALLDIPVGELHSRCCRLVQVVDDKHVASKIRISFHRLHDAQTELMQAGLLAIVRLRDCARYRFLQTPETPAGETDEEAWQRYTEQAL